MKTRYLYILICLMFFGNGFAQKEFHVFPKNHKTTPGKDSGDGSLANPWDLQTALNQKSDVVNGGDTIWLHNGVYRGRFISKLKSTSNNKLIVVSAYKNEIVLLDGNTNSNLDAVLKVQGKQVVFKNFEITFQGEFLRNESDKNFKPIYGINHVSGMNCEFINLKIHNNPGNGIGSWNKTGGSKILNCLIFNNGYIGKNRGSGVGIYTQNSSEQTKIIKNNIIFNNYYKGIEVWSANKRADYEYVKHFLIEGNTLFNSGSPSGKRYDNLIVGTDDRNGINSAKDINIFGNTFYHNTDVLNGQVNGDAPALTLGFHVNAPLKNATVKNNVIIGRNNALRILYTQSMIFSNNTVYSGYLHIDPSFNKKQTFWKFSNNSYFTKRQGAFRFHNDYTHDLSSWRNNITQDKGSQWKHLKEFKVKPVLNSIKVESIKPIYRVTVFNKESRNVDVDFSEYNQKEGNSYQIKNIEDNSVITSGVLNDSKIVELPMGNFNKTHTNFGVYIIEFEATQKTILKKKRKKKSFFKRLFDWF